MKDYRACIGQAHDRLQQQQPEALAAAQAGIARQVAEKWQRFRNRQAVAVAKLRGRYRGGI